METIGTVQAKSTHYEDTNIMQFRRLQKLTGDKCAHGGFNLARSQKSAPNHTPFKNARDSLKTDLQNQYTTRMSKKKPQSMP